MDSTHRRLQLPALSYLDIERTKRDEDTHQSRRIGTPPNLSTSASPTYHYPPGPPPPYSHTTNIVPPTNHANNWSALRSATHTPPDSRRTSEQERDGIKQSRQSLPSISEALGVDTQTTFAPSHVPPATSQPAHPAQLSSVAPSSTSPSPRRSYPMEPPHGPNTSYSGVTLSQYSQYRSEPTVLPQPSHSNSTETASGLTSYAPSSEPKAPLHLQDSPPRSTQPPVFFGAPGSSPTREQPQAVGSMGPPSSFTYGYTPYPPRYANPTPPSSVTSGPINQSSAVYGIQSASSTWKGDGPSRYDDRQSVPANYGDNVKRHLDLYDLETALNEIASTSGILSDFSRRYGDRMHQTQRSGTPLSMLPGIVEVDDMIAKTRVQQDSLLKIRDVVLAQQAAYEQQAADQRQQHKAFSEAPPPQAEHHVPDLEENKAGNFAGADTKKRRGRAAPPGRCHSCNRAETPEWRRGPDGARTLCNACGLHYAKLTRKNNGGNKSTTVAGSSIRPKEHMQQ